MGMCAMELLAQEQGKLFPTIKIFVFQYQYLIIFIIYDNDAS